MRLVFLFVGMAVVFLAVWMIWGGSWDERFTLEGTVAWLEGTGSWAWAAGIGLLIADLVLPMPGTIVMAALGYVYGPWLGGLLAFGTGGGWVVALSRSLPILPEVVSCMAGISRMPFGRFLLASVCGNLPLAFAFGFIGASGKNAPWWAIAASIGVPAVLWLLAKRWRGRDASPRRPAGDG